MAFTRGLFYPWIDIRNEAWLKTAALYWDTIQTIVPQAVGVPYKARAARILYEHQILEPLVVDPSMRDIESLTETVLKYLDSPEGLAVLAGVGRPGYRYIHPDKLPREIRDVVRLHPEKLPDLVRDKLNAGCEQLDHDSGIPVDSRFAAFYMTLLATQLSERHGLGLLTDIAELDQLSTSIRLDSRVPLRPRPQWHRSRYRGRDDNWNAPAPLAEGLLAHLVLERLQVNPRTSIERIIQFRREHPDELGRFRAKLGVLTASVKEAEPVNKMHQRVEDLYKTEVQPAIEDLKQALTGNKIKYATENFVKVAFFSMGALSFPVMVAGMSAPFALLVGAGVSLTASVVLYNVDRERQLAANPYSYLLAAERDLH